MEAVLVSDELHGRSAQFYLALISVVITNTKEFLMVTYIGNSPEGNLKSKGNSENPRLEQFGHIQQINYGILAFNILVLRKSGLIIFLLCGVGHVR